LRAEGLKPQNLTADQGACLLFAETILHEKNPRLCWCDGTSWKSGCETRGLSGRYNYDYSPMMTHRSAEFAGSLADNTSSSPHT
jgi:hypothetical protein